MCLIALSQIKHSIPFNSVYKQKLQRPSKVLFWASIAFSSPPYAISRTFFFWGKLLVLDYGCSGTISLSPTGFTDGWGSFWAEQIGKKSYPATFLHYISLCVCTDIISISKANQTHLPLPMVFWFHPRVTRFSWADRVTRNKFSYIKSFFFLLQLPNFTFFAWLLINYLLTSIPSSFSPHCYLK